MASRAQQRDEGFEKTLLAEWSVLVSVASRYRGSDADPNDVLQEGVTRAYRAWQRGRVNEDLARYLTVTVRNVAIGLRRRQQAESRALNRLAASDALSTAPAADDRALEMEERSQLRAAFELLSTRCQEILTLRVLHALPEAEVAEKLMIARGTVKSRCHRCLAELETSVKAIR